MPCMGNPSRTMKTVPAWSRLQHFTMVTHILHAPGGECLFDIAHIGKNCLRGKLPMPMLRGHRTDCADSVAIARLADVAPSGRREHKRHRAKRCRLSLP